MKVLIVGAGAVGAYLGFCLAEAGCKVFFLEHRSIQDVTTIEIKANGKTGKLIINKITIDQIKALKPNACFVTVKNNQLDEVCKNLSVFLNLTCEIFFLQNGLKAYNLSLIHI